MKVNRVFYASGTKGQSVRADGNGGVMAKGWWVHKPRGGLFGPFPTERKADDFAGTQA